MLSRLSIPVRLLLLLFVPLAALMIVGLTGLATINATNTATRNLQARLAQQVQLEAMRETVRRSVLGITSGVALAHLPAEEALRRLEDARRDFESAAAAYVADAPEYNRDRAQGTIQSVLRDFALFTNALASTLRRGEVDSREVAADGSRAAALKIVDTLGEILARERVASDRLIVAEHERGEAFFALNATLAFAGLGLALLLGFYIGRSITRPVRKVIDTVHAVAAGNIEARTQLSGYDEVAELGGALDRLLEEKVTTLARAQVENAQLNDSVIELLRAVSKLSHRDLTVRVPVTEDVTGPIADAINKLASDTGRVLADVNAVAEQVAAASAQVRTRADSVNAVATSQQFEATDTADQLSHASVRLAEISKLAGECNSLAQRAAHNTESAVATVTDTLRGMGDIREVIQETGKRIKRVGERSQEISGIVDIINRIAERTTVLALNTSMHAAAAGDAGRAFGVLADEVQRLAENTRNAAGQIGGLIKSMQIETGDTISAMEGAIGQVVAGSRMAEEAGKQIGETQRATTALVQSVLQIAAGSHEQAQLSVTLQDRARTMLKGVRTTGEHVAGQLQEAVNLTGFAKRLLDSVQVFKLPA
jgi:methyl-accepting chemotaxis protein